MAQLKDTIINGTLTLDNGGGGGSVRRCRTVHKRFRE